MLGPLLHLLMDYGNNYGVHPFWPFDNRWVYGDSIFIVEPLWWAAVIPSLVAAVRTRVARGVLLALLLGGLVMVWASGMVPPPAAVVVTLLAIVMGVVAWRLSPPGAWSQLSVRRWPWRRLRRRRGTSPAPASRSCLHATSPRRRCATQITTPMPADPLCWQALVVATATSTYSVTRATLSLAPGFIAPADCRGRGGTPTAPFSRVEAPGSASVLFHGRFSAARAGLSALDRDNCQARAFLRWARAPFWVDRGARGLVVGDLRYDRSPGLGFAELQIARRPALCPEHVPPWVPPRAALLY